MIHALQVKKRDERFESAFYFALGNTLVAADLDAATSAAFREGSSRAHHRVVTTAGDLIDKRYEARVVNPSPPAGDFLCLTLSTYRDQRVGAFGREYFPQT